MSKSPLKEPPLRHAGQSLDEHIERVIDDHWVPYLLTALILWVIALIEWFGAWRSIPRLPWAFTVAAFAATVLAVCQVARVRKRLHSLRLGRDGERVVGQFLDGLRVTGSRIFHDVPGDGFNVDHVVISAHGIFAVETKTVSKPGPNAKVVFDGERVVVGGRELDRDPVRQTPAAANWLRQLLLNSSGRSFPVRGVVALPGWWVERTNRERATEVWVLEPKAIPGFIEHEPSVIQPEDVAMAAFHLSRYIRSTNGADKASASQLDDK